jgi:tetratricopeptide (TPR) repeat protein
MSSNFLFKEVPTPARIFVSSTYFDLKSTRQELIQFLTELGFEPVVFETAGAIPNIPAADSALQHAAQADICILIVGAKYGSKSEQSQISYTHAEYRTAMDMGRPIFAFVERETLVKFDLFKSREGATFWNEDEQNLFRFLQEVSTQGSRFPFDSLSELKRAIRYQLSSYFGYLVRQFAILDSLSGGSDEAWIYIGNNFWSSGQFGRALYCYRASLELNEYHQYGLENVARSLRLTGRPREALPFLRKGIEKYPHLSVYRRELSNSLFDMGEKDEAIRSAEETVALFPNDYRSWGTLADIYRRIERLKDAANAAKKSYDLHPEDPSTYRIFLDLSPFLDEGKRG